MAGGVDKSTFMHQNQTCCPVCASAAFCIVYRAKAHHRRDQISEINIARCTECKTAYLHGSDHSFREDMYAYYKRFAGRPMEDLVSPLTLESYNRVLRELRKRCDLKSILDVGCGKGEFVWAALGQGCAIEGLELSAEAVSIAHSLGLPVRRQSLFSSDLDLRRWSCVTMFEVLEHLDEPIAMINRATDLLEEGGLLYLTTPNYNSLDRLALGSTWNVFHPEHITYFSTSGLVRLLQRLEPRLQLISVESNNVSPELIDCVFDLLKFPSKGIEPEGHQLNRVSSHSFLDPDLRALSESSSFTRGAKKIMNKLLSLVGMGSTTIITARRLGS